MKKILILGVKGSLGQEMTEVFADYKPIVWGKEDLDVTNREQVIKKIIDAKPDRVINCTAYNAVDRAEDEPEKAYAINGDAVGYLAEACKLVGSVLVHYSTNFVFDGKNPSGYSEADVPVPQSVYAKSKFLGEQKALSYHKSYVIRTAWLYGRPGKGEFSKKSFIQAMLEKAKEGSVNVVSDQFGNPTYTKDVAQATRALVEEKKPFGTYHFVNEEAATWYEWAKEIFKIKNLEVKVNEVSYKDFVRKANVGQYLILNNTKFITFRPWQEALKEFLNT